MSDAAHRSPAAPLLEARGITKRFGAITALDGVHLRLFPGEVLGVVGDNGAGKSTLMKVLSGLHAPTDGEIVFDSRTVVLHSPRDAQNIGIEMVYQDLALAGNLPIHENIYLGREPGRRVLGFTIVDEKLSRKMAMDHLDRLNITVKSVDQSVEELSGGQAQAVAIARATAFEGRVVIMDEPTAALAIKEVGKVLDLIKRPQGPRRERHPDQPPMDDVFFVCDRVMGPLPRPQLRGGADRRDQSQRSHRLDHGDAGPCRRARARGGLSGWPSDRRKRPRGGG